MKRDFETEWERDLDRRLKSLGEIEAPSNLLPSVLGIIEKRRLLKWYQQPYYTWSTPNKFKASLAFAIFSAVVATVYYQGITLVSFNSINFEFVQRISALSENFSGIEESLSVLGRTVLMKYALGLSAIAFLIYGSTLGSGTLVWKLMRQKGGGQNVA